MSAQKPRAAYCTGCGNTFEKMHLMIRHRRNERCGGRFLPDYKRDRLDQIRGDREYIARYNREEERLSKRTPAQVISDRRRDAWKEAGRG